MHWYAIRRRLTPLEREPAADEPAVVLLTSEELTHRPQLSGLETVLPHTPLARDARVCRAEVRPDCLSGTVVSPHTGKDGGRFACGWLATTNRVVLVDDNDSLPPYLKRIAREVEWAAGASTGRFLSSFFGQLTARDLHRLEEIEDRAAHLEEQVLSGQLEAFSAPMSSLRRESTAWFRYYSQLGDMASRLLENENGLFSADEQLLLRVFEERINRLQQESQLLREYCAQIQTLFQSEIDIRQNRIMQILTIVTTIFLPLSLLAGWYGMNFVGMPELRWKYGYPVICVLSVMIVAVCLWICKKKKFW